MKQSNLRPPLESPEALVDEDVDPQRGAYFPRRYLTDFFDFLKSRDDLFEVITYADMPWGDDCDYENNYPIEWRNWQRQLASGKRDPNKIYIILQYDVDSRPERTMALLRDPAHAGIPANVMIFNRRVDRRRLKNTGIVAFTDYELDNQLLEDCREQGFVIGYHTNAYERSGFQLSSALEIFDADVSELSHNFPIRFFSAHGGVPDAEGRNNCHLPFHPGWVRKLRWVHNGHSPRVDGQFSDGGHNSIKRDPLNRDIRDFVKELRAGGRYRILLHPQYYDEKPKISPRFVGTPWYDALIASSDKPDKPSSWEGMRQTYDNISPARPKKGNLAERARDIFRRRS